MRPPTPPVTTTSPPGATLLAEALDSRSYPSLESEFQIPAGENHATSQYLGLNRALRYLWNLPNEKMP